MQPCGDTSIADGLVGIKSISQDSTKVCLRTPHKKCNLVPECDLKDEQKCEIKDIVVSVQV